MMNKIPDAHLQDLPASLSQPARRALHQAGIYNLRQAAAIPETQLAKLHGIGPKAVLALRAALAEQGLAFAADEPSSAQSRAEEPGSAV